MKLLSLFVGVIITTNLVSCIDEDADISGQIVILKYPYDEQVTKNQLVNFSWQFVPNANRYRLLVSDSTESVVIDTVLFGDAFKKVMEPGAYFWQVHAINGVSLSGSPVYFFEIDTTIGDEHVWNTSVALVAPADNATFIPNSNFIIWWDAVPGALGYMVQVVKPNFVNPETIVLTKYHFDEKMYISLDSGSYQWRVLAYKQVMAFSPEFNDIVPSELDSPFSEPRTITIKP